jgi:predicted RNA-binding Zn ribbon-like protein
MEISGFAAYPLGVETARRPANTDVDTTPPAPGDLELVRGFLSVHDHAAGTRDSLPPSSETIAWWLRERGLLAGGGAPAEAELRWAAQILEALRSRVGENTGAPADADAIRALDRAARETELTLDFAGKALRPDAPGVRGAVGRILAIAFLAELDGSWSRFKRCSSPTCRAVFWDRSKNRSGRWCTMKDCGNRAKVRAYRERERRTA